MFQEAKSDDAVITRVEAAELIGISPDTLDRMSARREGPPRVRISDRRVGYRMRELRKWIGDRVEARIG